MYEAYCFFGACYTNQAGISYFNQDVTTVWLWIVSIGYTLSFIGFATVVYCLVQLFELREREHKYYSTLISTPEEEHAILSRWQRITALAAGTKTSEWREAIIEADIMLEDVLAQRGFPGAGVGEKLKSADAGSLKTLQDAWEAHKVRNQIAHEGMAFNISDGLTQRTITRYENVFRELKIL